MMTISATCPVLFCPGYTGDLSSIQSIDKERWKNIGIQLLTLLDSDEVKSNEYFRLSIVSVFTKNKYIDHFVNQLFQLMCQL